MNFLLDSHTLVWAVVYPEKLSVSARESIELQGNDLFVSTVSFWELSIKFNLKKLEMKGISPLDLLSAAKDIGIKMISLHEMESASFFKLPMQYHRDPFDRMLAWQCIKRNYTLISKDKRMNSYEPLGLKVVW
ncbi:MAG: type II toxin-antitoxin system VapC family toxin [Chitinophagaceae bacterium]|nr:type II toxin-antitoxin system VapC family toxin [Chitinophagaceae bacterium]